MNGNTLGIKPNFCQPLYIISDLLFQAQRIIG
jgi:hypothetical protein